ncbi:MAG: hypothetical protein LBH96_05455 [Candidatus Peribacteria bacterium]|jgi:hypothetical protein|nr:hypothetical protein [Candidatus Peribacteria bacterium]
MTPPSNDNAKLLITEVFYDDCAEEERCDSIIEKGERIEIFNIGEGAFQGAITLSGKIFSESQTSFLYTNLYIPAQDYIILANDETLFNSLTGVIVNKNQDFPLFSIPDNEEIFIELIFSGHTLDTFFVDQYRVNKRDDYQASFHKLLIDT